MKQKNLLYIFADQWRYHAAGFANEDAVLTPNMDAFAENSMCFTQAISTYPLCSPHRASLFTGKYPTSCGMWTNCKTGLNDALMLRPQEICISDVLHDEGYYTGYIGKWHLDASEMNFTPNPISGAKDWDAYTPEGERRHHFDFWHSYGAMDLHTDPHYWENSPQKIKPCKWSPEHETDMTINYLKNRDNSKPFCLFVAWNPPHPPYDLLPEKYAIMYKSADIPYRENVPQEMRDDPKYNRDRELYFGAVSGLDEQFGRIMQQLKQSGLLDDTIVVLSADHGDCMGSHGVYGKNIWYEESIHIPLVIGGADVKKGTADCLLASPDHAPTLLGALGIEPPKCMEGTDLSLAIYGEKPENAPKTAFLCMLPGMPEMVRAYTSRGLNSRSFGWRGVRTHTHTYVVDNGTTPDTPQTRYLYDNKKDPLQLHPIKLQKGEPQDKKYEKILRKYLKQLNDEFLLDR